MLKIINKLVTEGIIDKYAIADGMAQFYYIEPSVTYDLDLIVHILGEENSLKPLDKLYDWVKKNNYSTDREHIIIEGIPMQFLLAYNELAKEALEHSIKVKLFEEQTYILKAEYLMAIMLQTGRMVDKERFIRFLREAEFDKVQFIKVIEKFNLTKVYKKVLNGK
ncbi:MAG: hypothetical protein WAR79_20795 [Melioribacteraceae bacterium]